MALWAWAGVPLGVYNIVSDFSVALRIQPQILTVLSLATWIQCYYYQQVRFYFPPFTPNTADISFKSWTVTRSFVTVIPVAALMAGSQATLIIGLRILKKRHIEWPITLMAILSAVLLAAGVLRHYWDIWVHRTVRGVSFVFVGIDAAGDVFSLLSILHQPTLDILGIVIYATEFVLWCGILLCGGYYNLLPWIQKRPAQRSHDTTENEPAPGLHGRATTNVTLHDIPSSTSVFRTASSDLAGIRPRTVITL
ncbi:hypothetical protein DL764_010096 [Monosporascus ibericus]|uniref:PQ loop repeat protein n=1 Tax=Monosporascus ibericus TaxID=155417 RepID=A0A4Q4SVN3_9PEZI|nr:hypothetical protein DL764_010096 [Monosporascus ibericus]